MATCVKRICEAVLGDERIVLPVSTMAAGQYGIEGVCVGMPCVIGRHGVEEIPVLHSETEVELRRTAEWTRAAYDKLMSNTIAASVTG
jgi:L-lactate dehydrogenase